MASKALCDSFCTNSHYAKVGGIKLDELNLLERGLIAGLGWKLTVRLFFCSKNFRWSLSAKLT